MKKIALLSLLSLAFVFAGKAQAPNEVFWKNLQGHCGKAYAGEVTTPMSENDPFYGQTLIMHVVDCGPDFVHIPFFVGEDKSRTWVLTWEDGLIKLKHDHRHEDGSEDKVTQYGGLSSNTGFPNLQYFPADQETADRIPYAAGNVWWITLDDNAFTYNLRRVGSDRFISVKFDLSKEVKSPGPAWGWEK